MSKEQKRRCAARDRNAGTPWRLTPLAAVIAGLAYAGGAPAQSNVTPSGTYGPGSFDAAFQFFGTDGVIQGGTTIYPQPPYPFGFGGAGVSVASRGSAIINPDLGPAPGAIVIESDYRAGAPNTALYVANGTLTVVGSRDPGRLTYVRGHGQSAHGIYIPGETGPSLFTGAGMVMSADGPDANAIRAYGGFASADVRNATLQTTGNGHGVLAWGGALVKLTDTDITVQGAGAYGIFAFSGARIETAGGNVNTSLAGARGLYLNGATGTLAGTDVTTQGTSAYGIEAAGSTLSVTGGNVRTQGNTAYGLYLYGNTATTLDGAAVTTAGTSAHGIFVSSGTLNALAATVTATGPSARGLYVAGGATVVANQSQFAAQGDAGMGTWVNGAGSSLTMTAGGLSGALANGHGAYVSAGGSLRATDTAISSAAAVGLFAVGSTVELTRGTVSGGAYGVYLSDGATLRATGTAITSGSGATRGVQAAASTLDLTDVSVSTATADDHAIYAYNGSTLHARNLMLATQGQNAYGLRLIGAPSAQIDGMAVRTAGSGAHGAVFEGGATAYTGSNFDIGTSGGGIGIYAWQGTALSLAGGRVDTGSAANAHGIYINDATVDLAPNAQGAGVSVTTGGAGAHAVRISSGGRFSAAGASLHAAGPGAAGIHLLGVADAASASAIANAAPAPAPVAPPNDDGAPAPVVSAPPVPALAQALGTTETVTLANSSVVSDAGAAISVAGGAATIAASGTTIQGVAALQVMGRQDSSAGTPVNVPGVATLNASASTLTGAALTGSDSQSTLNLSQGSRWNVTASSVLTNLGNDSSVIDVQAAPGLPLGRRRSLRASPIPGNAYHTVTVTSDYAGTSGVVALNTFLDEGGSLAQQFTDRLLIRGAASGTTTVQVKPVATSPGAITSPTGVVNASEGISVVQVAGNSTPDAFALKGGYVTAANSPYAYRLYAYGPGSSISAADANASLVGNASSYWDYRLQSAYVEPDGPVVPDPDQPIPPDARPAVAPQVASYVTAPAAFLHAGMLDLDSLHRRLGEVRDDRALARDQGPGEVFFRAYGGNFRYTSNQPFERYGYDASGDYAAIHLGGNLFRQEDETGLWRFGVAGSIGWLHFSPHAADGPSSTRATIYRISGYGTYQSNQGLYVDGILSGGWFDGDVSTQARGKAGAMDGSLFAASIEAGYPLAMPYGLNLEPQLQLVGQHVSFRNTIDVDDLEVNIGSQNQLVGRAGVRLTRPMALAGGRLTPYLGFDLFHAFTGGTNVQVGEVQFESGKLGDAYQLSLGVNGMPTGRLSLYGRVSYQHAMGRGGVQGWLFNAGARYMF
ncbi:autotransporter outer membrane beta-barrel domain-containing protein [Cupriavidus necator]|uniref:autotransporter outer membrane beta-barrel domain-containing protein n=1 Tax=Cupriavidus necator TaxID=106590 RepID=UPI00278112B3|nr:autotransporter outer membrane beta-barrel domain-containing protein [Cupriavidus necator]MDQ0140723.1 outer membrane autotransporter protein [Cupriavidus necator]